MHGPQYCPVSLSNSPPPDQSQIRFALHKQLNLRSWLDYLPGMNIATIFSVSPQQRAHRYRWSVDTRCLMADICLNGALVGFPRFRIFEFRRETPVFDS